MSDETKNKTAADTAAENVQAIAEAVADNAPGAGDVAPAKPGRSGSKPKSKAETEPDGGASALRAVGQAACRRHGLARAWVTGDGQAFALEGDAREHARNLGDKTTLKVTAK